MNNITQSLDADWEQKILNTNLNDDFKKTYISAIEKENSIQKKLYLYTMFFQWNGIANTFQEYMEINYEKYYKRKNKRDYFKHCRSEVKRK